MVKMNINVDGGALAQLQAASSRIRAGVMPATSGAMRGGANFVRDLWIDFAKGGPLPGVLPLENPSGGYARSIRVQKNGPFDYEIYSEAKIAEWIEYGTTRLDMKKTHPYGPRSRITKNGKHKGLPYLIVPFRWGTPDAVGFRNIMPEAVYNIVKNEKRFERSKALMSTHDEPNARGENVERWKYQWGDRRGDKGNINGLVAMDTSGRRKRTAYFTFRIISAASPAGSWIKPATPARRVTQALKDIAEEAITESVDGAIRDDLGI